MAPTSQLSERKQEDDMNAIIALILVAVSATVFSLLFGVTAMARGSDVLHTDSAHWMMWRVVCQTAALALIVIALLA